MNIVAAAPVHVSEQPITVGDKEANPDGIFPVLQARRSKRPVRESESLGNGIRLKGQASTHCEARAKAWCCRISAVYRGCDLAGLFGRRCCLLDVSGNQQGVGKVELR